MNGKNNNKIPKNSKVFVVDPKGNGEAGVITRYYLDQVIIIE